MSSSTTSTPSATHRDPYYGYGPISFLSTSIVTTLFPPTTSASENSPPLTESGKRMPKLVDFIAYALYRTRLNDAIVHSALLLLTRLKQRYPTARGTSSSPHRLFLSALMLASKMSMDDTYSNKSWVIVGQNLFSLSEVNRMERELFGFLNSNCYVTKEELKAWYHEWCDQVDDEEADVVYEIGVETTGEEGTMMPSNQPNLTGCDSSDSNSPVSYSTTATSSPSPSPRTPPEEASAKEQSVCCNRWNQTERQIDRIAPSTQVKASNPRGTTVTSLRHILNSPL